MGTSILRVKHWLEPVSTSQENVKREQKEREGRLEERGRQRWRNGAEKGKRRPPKLQNPSATFL